MDAEEVGQLDLGIAQAQTTQGAQAKDPEGFVGQLPRASGNSIRFSAMVILRIQPYLGHGVLLTLLGKFHAGVISAAAGLRAAKTTYRVSCQYDHHEKTEPGWGEVKQSWNEPLQPLGNGAAWAAASKRIFRSRTSTIVAGDRAWVLCQGEVAAAANGGQ